MARAVGLDIGSHAVRAAELNLGHPPELVGFGQVGLPRGAVEHGEVVDPGAVAAAIRRLWKEAHLRDRRVRLGLASLRTIIRQVEMPVMDEDELRGALEFQAGEFIPLPPEETVLEFQVLEHFGGPSGAGDRGPQGEAAGEPTMRVLIAAIHRDTLQTAVTAVREAGLQTVAVDLSPFALLRSLAIPLAAGLPPAGVGEEGAVGEPGAEPGAEVIVSVGSGVTIVVIHEGGRVRFVRIVDLGGDDLTLAVQSGLDLTFEEAEALKRRLPTAPEGRDEALGAIEAPLTSLVNEIRGSVDFYAAQAGAHPLRRALLTGGGVLLDGFEERIGTTLAVPAEMADPTPFIRTGDIGFPLEDLPALSPYLPVPLGLALGADRLAAYRVNLLSERERGVLPFRRVLLAAGAAAAVVVGGIGLLTMQRNDELAGARDDLDAQESTNQDLQARVAALSGARDLQSEADQGRALLASVLGSEVSWSRVLQEVARVIPGDVWLTDFQGTSAASAEEGGGSEAATTTGVGSVAVTASGADFPGAAAWLQRIATLPSVRFPWLSQITFGSVDVGDTQFEGVNFTASVQLTDAARSERARRAATRAGVAFPPPSDTATTTTTAPPAEGGGG